MISFTQAQINEWLTAFIWPLVRILTLVATAPVLGNTIVPVRVKIGLAVGITLLVSPVLGPMPQIEPGSIPGLFIIAQQIAIGAAMGLAMQIVFVAVEMAGDITGLQMGLGFATFYDPNSGGSTAVIAQYMNLVATLVFLAVNGHLLMISTLVDSFSAFPIGGQPMHAAGWLTPVYWGERIFFAGLLLSLPMLGALLITNMALGILTRAAPQLNIFAVGFPITLTVGMGVLALSLPYFIPVLDHLMRDGFEIMLKIAKLLGNP
ncbi:MAG: flagellar biosynthetic protein FliR [Burkholderiales bacterium]|nr:flagellar biosynthetic protein FliR [Burkholderiales bacterium]